MIDRSNVGKPACISQVAVSGILQLITRFSQFILRIAGKACKKTFCFQDLLLSQALFPFQFMRCFCHIISLVIARKPEDLNLRT